MSLLLQALKRAEKTKRQNESAGDATPLPQLEELELAPPAAETAAAPAFDLELVQHPATSEPKQAVELPLEIESHSLGPHAEAVLAEPAQPESPPQPAPSPAPSPTPAAAREPVASASPPPSPAAARQLLSAPRVKPQKSLLPWLALGGSLLMGGMGAWFWWQFQQLTSPATQILPVPAQATASMPAALSAPAATAASTPESAPGMDAASAIAALSARAPAVIIAPHTQAAEPAGKSVRASRLPPGDKATYVEPQTAQQPSIKRHIREAVIPAPLDAAWNAFQKGDLTTAEAQYRRMLGIDPRNRDALLGLAAIATRQDKKPEATALYKRLLALNPQDEEAQAGLLSVDHTSMGEHQEAQLLQQGKQPRSPLALAQYYAARNRWHEAQEQYFRAFAQDPKNADLAFNLAVSLEHIRQPGLAAEYYRKALTLEHGGFDRAVAERRLTEIQAGKK